MSRLENALSDLGGVSEAFEKGVSEAFKYHLKISFKGAGTRAVTHHKAILLIREGRSLARHLALQRAEGDEAVLRLGRFPLLSHVCARF